MTETTQTIEGNQGTIQLRHWAPEDPRSIVLLVHGYGEHSGRYRHVAARLVDAGSVVYAPDHFGHGRSGGERALVDDIDDLVDDLATVEALAREAYPGLPVAVLGHSMGGLIATRYVQRDHDVAALVLTGPVVGGNPEIEALLALDPLPDVPLDPAILSRDPAVGEAYAADPLVYHGPFQRPTLEAIFGGVDRVAEGAGFGDLPVLWIHGEEDGLAPLAATRTAMDRLGGTRVVSHVRAGAQHEVLNEIDKDEVLDEIVDFLAQTLQAAPATS